MKLLIDGDMLVYTLGFASERKGYYIDGTEYHEGDIGLCKRLIRNAIRKYCKLFDTNEYTLVLSGKGNYRTSFYPEYKANRAALVKPLVYEKIREWIMSLEECVVINGEEADDYLSQQITGPDRHTYTIISADKDFFTAPGRTYNISTKRLFNPTVEQSLCFLLFQALSGDRVDGYYGVQWIGVTKAQKLLKACKLKKKTYGQAYLFLKDAIINRGGKGAWKHFRLCLSLAAIKWHGEVGNISTGPKRIWKHRHLKLAYFTPYYNPEHNIMYGETVGDLY